MQWLPRRPLKLEIQGSILAGSTPLSHCSDFVPADPRVTFSEMGQARIECNL